MATRAIPSSIPQFNFSPTATYTKGVVVKFNGDAFVTKSVINPDRENKPFDAKEYVNYYTGVEYNDSTRPYLINSATANLVPVQSIYVTDNITFSVKLTQAGTSYVTSNIRIEAGIVKITVGATTYNVADITAAITDGEFHDVVITGFQNGMREVFVSGVSYGKANVIGSIPLNGFGACEISFFKIENDNIIKHLFSFEENGGSTLYNSANTGVVANINSGSWGTMSGYSLNANYGYTVVGGVNVPVNFSDISKAADGSDIENTFGDTLNSINDHLVKITAQYMS